jgi:hypothetical protein
MWKVDRGSQIGVTTDLYVDALAWTVSEMGKKTFLLKNMESAGGNGLRYRLDGLVSFGGITTELAPETVLGGGEVAEFHYDRQNIELVYIRVGIFCCDVSRKSVLSVGYWRTVLKRSCSHRCPVNKLTLILRAKSSCDHPNFL